MLAEAVRTQDIPAGDERVAVTVSIGVCWGPADADPELSALMKVAQECQELAALQGGDRVHGAPLSVPSTVSH